MRTEPFDTVGCSELSGAPSLCSQHPRCEVVEGPQGAPRCLLSDAYLSLAASSLCERTPETAAAPRIEEKEMRAVVLDLMQEIGIEANPLLNALDATDAADAESLCSLVKVCIGFRVWGLEFLHVDLSLRNTDFMPCRHSLRI